MLVSVSRSVESWRLEAPRFGSVPHFCDKARTDVESRLSSQQFQSLRMTSSTCLFDLPSHTQAGIPSLLGHVWDEDLNSSSVDENDEADM